MTSRRTFLHTAAVLGGSAALGCTGSIAGPEDTGGADTGGANDGGLTDTPRDSGNQDAPIDPGLPAYLRSAPLFTAADIPGATMGIPGAAQAAWGCLVLIAGTNRLVSAANGGHTDSGDNGVYEIDLGVDSPTWTTKIAPSASVAPNVAYQSDGLTHSRHGYQHGHYIPQRNRVLLVGARGWYSDGGGTGDGQVDGVDVGSSIYTWDPAGTYPNIGGTFDERGFGIACDPLTGNVWTGAGYLWDQATNTWSRPGTWTGSLRWGYQWDTRRERFAGFHWGDGQGYATGFRAEILDRAAGIATSIGWATDAETQSCLSEISTANPSAGGSSGWPNYEASGYDQARDVFCYYFGHTSSPALANQWYEITPQDGASGWTMQRRVLTGMPLMQGSGVNGCFRYLPRLKGFYVFFNRDDGARFVRTAD